MKLSSLNKGKILHFKGNNVVPVDIMTNGNCENIPELLGTAGVIYPGFGGILSANESFGGRDGVLKISGDGINNGVHSFYMACNIPCDNSFVRFSLDYYIPSTNVDFTWLRIYVGFTEGDVNNGINNTTDTWTNCYLEHTAGGTIDKIMFPQIYSTVVGSSESIYIDNLVVEIYKLADRSTCHNNSIINGITFGSDRNGKADSSLVFDGSSYVDCGTSLDYSDKLTIVFLINNNTLGKFIFVKGDYSQAPKYDFGFYFPSAGSSLQIYYDNFSLNLEDSLPDFSQYNFYAIIIDGTFIQCQRNNIIHSAKTLSTTIPNTSLDLFIGALKNGTSHLYEFNGNIDELLIYNRVLTNSEISHLYESYNANAKISSLKKGLILDMPLNSTYYNSTTKKVSDKTPKHNNGTASATGVTVFDDYMEFDGSNGYIDGLNLDIADDEPWSIGIWINPNMTQDIIAFWGEELIATKHWRMFGVIHANRVNLCDSNGNFIGFTGHTWETGWQNWVLTCNGTDSSNLELFYNTISKGSQTLANSAIKLRRIADLGDGVYKLKGSTAKLKILNRVITEQEIKMLFNQERHLFGV